MKSSFDIAKLARAYGEGPRPRVSGVPAPDRIRRRIVLVDDEPASARRLEGLLREVGLPVWLVPEDEVESTLVAPTASTGIVVAAGDPLAVIRRLRQNSRLGYVHVVYTSAICGPRDVSRAFEAGVDDFVRKPWQDDVVVSRLARRFDAIAQAAMLHAQAVAADVLRRDVGLSPAALGVTETKTFVDAAEVMEEMLCDFIGQPIQVRQGRAHRPVLGAVVKLVDVEREVEVGAAVAADTPNCAALCRAFMGEGMDDASFFKDIVGELANMVMATLKSSLMADGFAPASGVPESRQPDAVQTEMKRYPARKMLLATGHDFQFTILLGVRLCPPSEQPVETIEEGMVLAQDLRDPEGELAARLGTRITNGLASRMRCWLPGKTVMVADLRSQAA